MKNRLLSALIIVACVVASYASAQGNTPYVWLKDNRKIPGKSLSADQDGTIHLIMQKGNAQQTFKRSQVRAAYIPKPDNVKKLEAAYESGRYPVVLGNAKKLFDQYKFLGWGDFIAYLEGMCHVKAKKYDEALKSFDQGKPYEFLFRDKLYGGRAMALIGMKQYTQAANYLKVLMKDADPGTAAFAFNARGKIYAETGKEREAVLEYLKTLLIISPADAGPERAVAKQEAVKLLRAMNHPRAGDIENMP